jgi:hypothetical protein
MRSKLVEKPGGKRPLGRSRRRWEVVLKWTYREIEFRVWVVITRFRIGTGGELL